MKKTLYILLFAFSLSISVFSQQAEFPDSITSNVFPIKKNTDINYSVGSSFLFMPKFGTVTGLTASAYLNKQFTPKMSIQAGLLMGRYYSNINFSESKSRNSFNSLAVFGTANYQVNNRLNIYGTGIKQLTGFPSLYSFPANSFSVGSTLKFGNFSVGADLRVTDYNSYRLDPFERNMNPFTYPAW